MTNSAGKTIAVLVIGAAIGMLTGYILGINSDKRQEKIGKLKNTIDEVKSRLSKKSLV